MLAFPFADGLDVVIARHMPDRHGKYIVFCSNVTHMNRMMELVPSWFSRLDSAPHIYRAYSPDPETREAFAAFREDESNHLKLLLTIDMLNEGIHVADVDGMILFRSTISPIICKKQIGRALSAGSAKTSVIFDVVNNIGNLCGIGAVEREFEEAVLRTGQSEQEREELRQRFQIIDEVRDCRQLFERLIDTLTATWDEMYGYAKVYCEKVGHLNIPRPTGRRRPRPGRLDSDPAGGPEGPPAGCAQRGTDCCVGQARHGLGCGQASVGAKI